MTRLFFITGAALGLVAVILGAFGAHGLKPRLSPDQLASFETGVRYQAIHAILLLVTGILAARYPSPLLSVSGMLVAIGILLFSGSIYLLATRELTGLTHWTWLGPVTPLGGLSMILGWTLLLVWAVRMKP